MKPYPYQNVAIVATGYSEPKQFITSKEIEKKLAASIKRLKLPTDLLASMTGIISRGLYPVDFLPSAIATEASLNLLANKFNPLKIDLLLSTSVCRDFLEPAVSAIVHSNLKLKNSCRFMDIGNACLGFLDGLEIAALQIENQKIEYALIVAGENSHPVLANTLEKLSHDSTTIKSFFQHFATLTLGSGGAAFLLGPADKHPKSAQLLGGVALTDSTASGFCRGTMEGMETDSAAMMNLGVALAQNTFSLGQQYFNWQVSDFDFLVTHQVSEVNTKKLSKSLQLPMEKLIKSYPKYGNMGAAAAPFIYSLYEEEIKTKKNILMMGIGSGLSCSMLKIKIN